MQVLTGTKREITIMLWDEQIAKAKKRLADSKKGFELYGDNEDWGAEAKKKLDTDVIKLLYEKFDAVTSYMHRILNVLFAKTPRGGRCKLNMVEEAIGYIIRLSSDTYESLFYQMPDKQRNVYMAIAQEGKVKEVTGESFVKKYKLPSASSVSSAIKGLLDKDFITIDKGYYSAYDQFFVLWMKYKKII